MFFRKLAVGFFAFSMVASAGVNCASPARADESGFTHEEIAALVDEAVNQASVSNGPVASGNVKVDISMDPSADITAAIPGIKKKMEIPLPEGIDLETGKRLADGSMVYLSKDDSVDVVANPFTDGVRLTTVIKDGESLTTFRYELPEGVVAKPLADGRLELHVAAHGEASVILGYIEKAWAVDSNGSLVPTEYELSGKFVIQHVYADPETVYPVVADPRFIFSPMGLHFSRAETVTIADSGWGVTGLTAACGLAGAAMGGPAGAAAASAACLVSAGPIVYTAGVAKNSGSNQCLHIRFNLLSRTAYPQAITCR